MANLNEMRDLVPQGDIILENWAQELNAIGQAMGTSFDKDYNRRLLTAAMLENTQKYLDRYQKLNEATQPADVSFFKKYAINMLSAMVPNLIAPDIVSVQPMLSRVGEARYIKVLYGSNKGNIKAGQQMFGTVGFNDEGVGNGNFMYTADRIEAEMIPADSETYLVAWAPIIPGTLEVNGKLDDGKGNIAGVGTVDYNQGLIKFTQATSDELEINYEYDNITAPVNAPEINLKIQNTPIVAKSRKLKALYSFDAAFDLSNDFGMQMNNELVAYSAAEIKHEIDGEIMNDLFRCAQAKQTTFDARVRDGISLRDHNEAFHNVMIEAGNNIFQATKMATGSWIIAGVGACNIIESLEGFVPAGAGLNPVGPHLVGHLKGKPVYKNPYLEADNYLVGYRGQGLFEAGFLYCPYMPIMSTQLIMDETFTGRRGFATAYGKKVVNGNMFSKGTIIRG
jgi:hypothetical protein